MYKFIAGLFLSISLALSASATSGGAGAPAITFTPKGIRVTGITPGGAVLIYAVAMVRADTGDHIERYQQVLHDDDHDGIVTYDHGMPIPTDGVWLAVDVTNGQYAVSSPLYGLKPARPQPQPLHRAASGRVETFALSYPGAEMIYIQPGHGVWAIHGYDRSASDRDSRPGVTGVSLSDAVSLLPSGETRATEFAPGGVIIAFDLPFFQVITMRLTGADIGSVP